MSEAIFTLIGVVVGALLQGGWSWAMERRRESWAARKAGRLFGPALWRCSFAITHSIEQRSSWGEMVEVVNSNLRRWPDDADVFAGTLTWDDWFEIYAPVRALEQMTWSAPDEPSQPVGPEHHDYLKGVSEQAMEGAFTCGMIAVSGTGAGGWRRWLKRAHARFRPLSEKQMLIEVFGDEEAAEEFLKNEDDDSR